MEHEAPVVEVQTSIGRLPANEAGMRILDSKLCESVDLLGRCPPGYFEAPLGSK
jgi:hypothetical protein